MTDTIVRCLLADPPLRVVAVIATEVAREAALRHRAVGGAQVALGRAAVCGLLLATLTKSGEQVTLQVLGRGPLGTLIADATDAGDVRVSVAHPDVLIPGPPDERIALADWIGPQGILGVARDLGQKFQSTGQAALTSGEIDEDIEHYLMTSEQIESAIGADVLLGASEVRVAAGVLVQCLPGEHEAAKVVLETRARLRGGALAALLVQGNASPEAIARTALGPSGHALEVLDQRPVRFRCPCSNERVRATLALLSAEDLEDLLREQGEAEITCEFCRAVYRIDAEELEALLIQSTGRAQT